MLGLMVSVVLDMGILDPMCRQSQSQSKRKPAPSTVRHQSRGPKTANHKDSAEFYPEAQSV